MDKTEKTKGGELVLDFGKITKIAEFCTEDVIPVVVQDVDSLQVLLCAYTNDSAFKKTQETGRLTIWSTSHNELWCKGETSGQVFEVIKIFINCKNNSLLYQVRPSTDTTGICHTKNRDGKYRKTCFYREIDLRTGDLILIEP